MKLKGRVTRMLPLAAGVSASGNNWRKQEFLFGFYAHESDIYETVIVLSLMNERIDEYQLKEGDRLDVDIRLTSREYNGRYFNDIRLTGITKLSLSAATPSAQSAAAQQAPALQQTAAQPTAPNTPENGQDDLPF